MAERIVVTAALPYANGPIHIGHLVGYIEADIFVRFLKLTGRKAIYICADDAHGTPIEINAKKNNLKPEEFIKKWFKEHSEDFKAFLINFDNYHTTHSKENKFYSEFFFETLKKKGYIYTKDVESSYCEKCKRFLPDRYVRGKCPKCGADDQYGDVCEVCNATYTTTDLIKPYCIVCESTPVRKKSIHYFFKLSAFSKELKKWLTSNKNLQPEVTNFVLNWIKDGLRDWDISRDGPYFGFKIPGEKEKYFYVWLDAPIGYIASTKNYCDKHKEKIQDYWKNGRVIQFIGKDIIYFHFLFWPAMLMGVGYKLPENIAVHGFLTVNKEKMSKSRGTFFTAREFLEVADPEYLRFYYASNLGSNMSDIDFDFKDFKATVNNKLVANIANFCYRTLSFCNANFNSKIGRIKRLDIIKDMNEKTEKVKEYYENYKLKEAVREILAISDIGNKYFQENEPWKLIKQDKEKTRDVITFCVNIVKNLSILVNPILPKFSIQIQEQLNLKDLNWKDLGFNLRDHEINDAEIIFKKIEELAVEKRETWPIDLRVGKIIKVDNHPNADKLYVLEVSVGKEKRILVAGLKDYYKKEELLDKKIVVVCNLKPTVLRGIKSEGMLLAGDDGQNIRLLEAEKSNLGDSVYPEATSFDGTEEIAFEDFMKFEIVTKNKRAVYQGKIVRTDKEELKINIKNSARVR